MIYAMTVALGFAALENIEYVIRFGAGVLVARALFSMPIHLACAAIWGYGLARARFISARKIMLKPPCLISWRRPGFMPRLIFLYFCGPGPSSWFFPC